MKFNEWKLNVENILPNILKKNLLIKPKYKPDYNLQLPAHTDLDTGKFIFFFYFTIKDLNSFDRNDPINNFIKF